MGRRGIKEYRAPEALALIAADRIAKGNVFATARLAGIQAAKRTAHLIPLCHNLGLSHVEVELKNLSAAVEDFAKRQRRYGVV